MNDVLTHYQKKKKTNYFTQVLKYFYSRIFVFWLLFLFTWGCLGQLACTSTNLHGFTGSEANDQVSLQWSLILAITWLEPKTTWNFNLFVMQSGWEIRNNKWMAMFARHHQSPTFWWCLPRKMAGQVFFFFFFSKVFLSRFNYLQAQVFRDLISALLSPR